MIGNHAEEYSIIVRQVSVFKNNIATQLARLANATLM